MHFFEFPCTERGFLCAVEEDHNSPAAYLSVCLSVCKLLVFNADLPKNRRPATFCMFVSPNVSPKNVGEFLLQVLLLNDAPKHAYTRTMLLGCEDAFRDVPSASHPGQPCSFNYVVRFLSFHNFLHSMSPSAHHLPTVPSSHFPD